MPSPGTRRTVSLGEITGELRRKLRSAFFKVTPGIARGTVCRTIIVFASCAIAAAFGGVALTAWKTALSLLAAKWSAEVERPATGERESDAAGVHPRGAGCERKGHDEHSEDTASRNWGSAFAPLRPTEVTHAELIQIHNAQIK